MLLPPFTTDELGNIRLKCQLSKFADKIDVLTGDLLSNSLSWRCLYLIVYPFHPGRLNSHVRQNAGTLFWKLNHADCDVEFEVMGTLDLKGGFIELIFPLDIGICSRDCKTQR